MLKKLHLKDIGGVREAELEFGAGLTVITGESGTGKSSIVRALELVSGRRGDVKMIRSGEVMGIVEASFSKQDMTGDPDMRGALDPSESEDGAKKPADDGTFTARRTITAHGGRSRVSVQGSPMSLASYAGLIGRFIRIQSQFAQMELLDADRQLAMIDSCASQQAHVALKELQRTFEEAGACSREIRAMKERRTEIERRFPNADEAMMLVRKAAPEKGLELRLETELSALRTRIAQRDRARSTLDTLTGGMAGSGLMDGLKNALSTLLDFMPEDARHEARLTTNDALNVIEDVISSAADFTDGSDSDEQDRDAIEARLGALRRLKRMSGLTDESELAAYCTDAAESLGWLEKNWPELEAMSARMLELKRHANSLATDVRNERRRAAAELETKVNALLEELAMPGMTLAARFRELPKLRRSGADEVAFMLCSGSREGRVDKIASGGELSRLLLALSLSLPDEWTPPTLVFDEVEAGLGGRAAVLAGLKLKELSQRCQVILVTHEASIAALGDMHILTKRTDGESVIRAVDGTERVREIARMLSGNPDMAEAQEHAAALCAGR